MYRTEYEMSEMVHARQTEVMRSCQRTRVRPMPKSRPVGNRIRRAIGHRFVVIGIALVGPL